MKGTFVGNESISDFPSATLRGPDGSIQASVRGWIAQARTDAFRSIIANMGSLVGTTLVTAGLGYLYWILAARQLPVAAVGIAGAAISAMTLLGTAGMLGFGTLLIGELPRHPGRERSLVALGVTVAGVVGTMLGVTFAIVAPALSPALAPLGADVGRMALFGLGVGLTSVTLVLDHALIGLSRGALQLVRNALFAAAKLGALLLASAWVPDADGLTIYGTWVAGNLISLAGLAAIVAWTRRGDKGTGARNERLSAESQPLLNGPLRRLGRAALAHHALNLALQAPYLVLPIVATTLLSATAYFYIAWVLAGFVFIGPGHLATALYAAAARTPAALASKVRFTLGLGLLVSIAANAAVFVGAGYLLGMFGEAYAEQAAWSLRVLGLWAFPLIVKDHYVVLRRLEGRAASAAWVVAIAGVLELVMASAGAALGGLSGLCVGWLLAGWLQVIVMLPTVYRAAHPSTVPDGSTEAVRTRPGLDEAKA